MRRRRLEGVFLDLPRLAYEHMHTVVRDDKLSLSPSSSYSRNHNPVIAASGNSTVES